MADVCDVEDFERWNIDSLRKYCRKRCLQVARFRKEDELVALAFAVFSQNYRIVADEDDEKLGGQREVCGIAGS
jgi:hypothetical protein